MRRFVYTDPMDVFDHFPTEKLTLVKKDGRRFENLEAVVASKSVLTQDPNVPIEDGDEFQRKLPSGVVETYIVTDAGFRQEFYGIPPHYQSKVRRSTAAPSGHSSTVYNLVGENSRVNIQSADSSTNVVAVNSSALFANIKEAIQQAPLDHAAAQQLLVRVEALEAAAGSQGFGQAYKDFIAAAADHMTLFAPFLPALSQLLT